jgi:hypothetical protein
VGMYFRFTNPIWYVTTHVHVKITINPKNKNSVDSKNTSKIKSKKNRRKKQTRHLGSDFRWWVPISVAHPQPFVKVGYSKYGSGSKPWYPGEPLKSYLMRVYPPNMEIHRVWSAVWSILIYPLVN